MSARRAVHVLEKLIKDDAHNYNTMNTRKLQVKSRKFKLSVCTESLCDLHARLTTERKEVGTCCRTFAWRQAKEAVSLSQSSVDLHGSIASSQTQLARFLTNLSYTLNKFLLKVPSTAMRANVVVSSTLYTAAATLLLCVTHV